MLAQPSAFGPLPTVGFLVFTVVWLVTTAVWLWALWDCLTKGRVSGREKIVWVIVLLCTHVVGTLLYFVVVRVMRSKGPGR